MRRKFRLRISTIKSGFTLIELLVVIAIISLLSSVALASLNIARKTASNTATLASLRTFKLMEEQYYIDHNKYIPANCAGGGDCYICDKPSNSTWNWPPLGMDPNTPNIFKNGVSSLPPGKCINYTSGYYGNGENYFDLVFYLYNVGSDPFGTYDKTIKQIFGDYPEYYGLACWNLTSASNAGLIGCYALSKGGH